MNIIFGVEGKLNRTCQLINQIVSGKISIVRNPLQIKSNTSGEEPAQESNIPNELDWLLHSDPLRKMGLQKIPQRNHSRHLASWCDKRQRWVKSEWK